MELPRSKQHECSRCHRNFNFAKTLEKHLLACKGISNIAVQMETPKDTLKGKGVDDEVFNGEIEIVPGSTEEAIPTYRTGVKTEIDNSKMELNYLITTNEAIMESTGDFVNGTLATEDDEKVTARESFNLYLTSDEEEQKERLKPREIIPCTPALRNRTPHEEVDPKNYKFASPYICPICSNSYTSREALRSHHNKHTDRFKCEHCNKTLQSARDLKEHTRRHLGIRPYKCIVCNAAFFNAAHLRNHMITHSPRKPQCPACEKTFASVADLKDHERKSCTVYKCDVCERAFSRKGMLNKHKIMHLGLKQHECTLCMCRFQTSQDFKAHQSICHKERCQRNGCVHKSPSSTEARTSNQNYDNEKQPKKRLKETSRKNNQLTENPPEETGCKAKFFEIQNARTLVKLEDQDSLLKDAICFADEQKFTPILDIADELTAIRASGPESYSKRITTNPAGQKNRMEVEYVE